jgi:enoyl-[acyl-carrier-protein] reductase (NADH)
VTTQTDATRVLDDYVTLARAAIEGRTEDVASAVGRAAVRYRGTHAGPALASLAGRRIVGAAEG